MIWMLKIGGSSLKIQMLYAIDDIVLEWMDMKEPKFFFKVKKYKVKSNSQTQIP